MLRGVFSGLSEEQTTAYITISSFYQVRNNFSVCLLQAFGYFFSNWDKTPTEVRSTYIHTYTLPNQLSSYLTNLKQYLFKVFLKGLCNPLDRLAFITNQLHRLLYNSVHSVWSKTKEILLDTCPASSLTLLLVSSSAQMDPKLTMRSKRFSLPPKFTCCCGVVASPDSSDFCRLPAAALYCLSWGTLHTKP